MPRKIPLTYWTCYLPVCSAVLQPSALPSSPSVMPTSTSSASSSPVDGDTGLFRKSARRNIPEEYTHNLLSVGIIHMPGIGITSWRLLVYYACDHTVGRFYCCRHPCCRTRYVKLVLPISWKVVVLVYYWQQVRNVVAQLCIHACMFLNQREHWFAATTVHSHQCALLFAVMTLHNCVSQNCTNDATYWCALFFCSSNYVIIFLCPWSEYKSDYSYRLMSQDWIVFSPNCADFCVCFRKKYNVIGLALPLNQCVCLSALSRFIF
jgi:hypothetical protein